VTEAWRLDDDWCSKCFRQVRIPCNHDLVVPGRSQSSPLEAFRSFWCDGLSAESLLDRRWGYCRKVDVYLWMVTGRETIHPWSIHCKFLYPVWLFSTFGRIPSNSVVLIFVISNSTMPVFQHYFVSGWQIKFPSWDSTDTGSHPSDQGIVKVKTNQDVEGRN